MEEFRLELKLDLFEIGGAASRVDVEVEEGGGGGDKIPKAEFPLLRFELELLPRGEGLIELAVEALVVRLLNPFIELELPV